MVASCPPVLVSAAKRVVTDQSHSGGAVAIGDKILYCVRWIHSVTGVEMCDYYACLVIGVAPEMHQGELKRYLRCLGEWVTAAGPDFDESRAPWSKSVDYMEQRPEEYSGLWLQGDPRNFDPQRGVHRYPDGHPKEGQPTHGGFYFADEARHEAYAEEFPHEAQELNQG